jgi:hypothetical protein
MLAYLPGGGWYGASEDNANRIRFERENGETPYVLMLPRTNKSPNSRRLLQAAIYTLCDVEDRQPAEIIRDILAMQVVKAVPAKEPQGFRLRFCNDNAEAVVLQVASRPGECLLMPGEIFEFVTHPLEGGTLDIRISPPSH